MIYIQHPRNSVIENVERMINGWSIFRRALALFIVSIMQDTYNVSESVQAMIFLENKSIILVR